MANNNKTEDEKIIEFNAEIKTLLGRYGYALGAVPIIVDGLIRAKPTVAKVDESQQKKASVLEQQ